MAWNIQLAGPVQKDFRKLPQKDKARIQAVLIGMADDPFSGDIVRLKGEQTAWRRRVGNYRIVYDLYFEEHLIIVAGILRRTSVTYR